MIKYFLSNNSPQSLRLKGIRLAFGLTVVWPAVWNNPRSVRPPILANEVKNDALKLALENPRSLKAGVAQLAEKLDASNGSPALNPKLRRSGHLLKLMRRASCSKRNIQF
ncbi:MAG: hypothetical protein ACOYLN_09365 [Blastocatellia bacterium]